jgi:hypothetical protein
VALSEADSEGVTLHGPQYIFTLATDTESEQSLSSYQLSYQGKAYQFETLSDAQEFLDKLPSRVGVEIVKAPLLFQLLNAPGAPQTNWREIIKEVDNEFGRVTTEESRAALLATFKATMDFAETMVAPENLQTFQEARQKHYKSFIVQEALVGGNICVETLYAVTQREIDAGRMTADDGLCKAAETGMAEPHPSRAELIAQMSAQHEPKPPSLWKRLWAWL